VTEAAGVEGDAAEAVVTEAQQEKAKVGAIVNAARNMGGNRR
jgi:hypothetical protein